MASRSTPRICPSERVALPIRAGTVELVIAESRLPPRPPFAPQWYRYGPHELSEGDAIERLERFWDDLA